MTPEQALTQIEQITCPKYEDNFKKQAARLRESVDSLESLNSQGLGMSIALGHD